MVFVEQITYPWADKITARREGDSIRVFGERWADDAESETTDALREYAEYAMHSKPLSGLRGGRLAPHVQLANASTDEELIAFVGKYGPLNGNAPGPLAKARQILEVAESIEGLRKGQAIFASAFNLLRCLREGGDIPNALGDLMHAVRRAPRGDERFEEDWILTLFIRAKQDRYRGDASGLEGFLRKLSEEQARTYGWYAFCALLGSFPPVIVPVKDGLAEMPKPSRAGILPTLMFMLRRDCLLDSEIKMCPQRDCGKWFKVERGGQEFCSPYCSQLQRQRDYWEIRGKELRIKRLGGKRYKKGGK